MSNNLKASRLQFYFLFHVDSMKNTLPLKKSFLTALPEPSVLTRSKVKDKLYTFECNVQHF